MTFVDTRTQAQSTIQCVENERASLSKFYMTHNFALESNKVPTCRAAAACSHSHTSVVAQSDHLKHDRALLDSLDASSQHVTASLAQAAAAAETRKAAQVRVCRCASAWSSRDQRCNAANIWRRLQQGAQLDAVSALARRANVCVRC